MAQEITLCREIRFTTEGGASAGASGNSFAGNPISHHFSPVLILRVGLLGRMDAGTGMLMNIRQVDQNVRGNLLPAIRQHAGDLTAAAILQHLWPIAAPGFMPAKLQSLEIAASPWLQHRIVNGDRAMIELTERFEFSAAHRLHSPQLTDQENADLFGKCNNPHGHGHNYELEVTVCGPIGADGTIIPPATFHEIINRLVINRMDHKNLNVQLAEFRALNPTVENIAANIFQTLSSAFAPPVRLKRVRLWETPKTSCQIEAAAAGSNGENQ